MRLCFGTFAKVLRICRQETVTDRQLVSSMTRTIDPNCKYIEQGSATAVSRLFSCEGNLSSGKTDGGSGAYQKVGENLSNVTQLALKFKTEDLIPKFQETVVPLLNEDKKSLAVLALKDIIKRDVELDNDNKMSFEKYLGRTKEEIAVQTDFELAEFLAGLFLYTVVSVKNTIGKQYVGEIDEDFILGFKEESWLITFKDRDKDIEETKPKTDIYLNDYLTKAKEKYSTIKTLLYSEQPRKFYDFYICNDIERRIPIQGRYRRTHKYEKIKDATIDKLSNFSRFIILTGTGGLGKSMMMRHLLLDSFNKYEDTGEIPVFIPLKDYDDSVSDLLEYVYIKLASIDESLSREAFETLLKGGKCQLLFDGLDEVSSNYASNFELELEIFTDKFPDNMYVISSRPYQSFVSYSRFTVLRLEPFSREQAIDLIEKLEFRVDEPSIKEKFLKELNTKLYWSHREFTQNPLLLTIMLMTFEQFAEVPSKMHIFYREAYSALSIKHDASKGAYRRVLKSGMNAERFADYFAELCSRSYYDEKFELNKLEFDKYYENLNERKKVDDFNTSPEDFLYDLCSNMCLMYSESGKYHFTHRSFQEYFCALYFSKQKDKTLKTIGDFFENRRSRMHGDKTFSMLYDMIPEKVDEYIFIPFLEKLFEKCDSEKSYWTFLEIMYPTIRYEKGDTDEWVMNTPNSYIFHFIVNEKISTTDTDDFSTLPHIDSLVDVEYAYVEDEEDGEVLVNVEEISYEYTWEYGDPDTVGWVFEMEIEDILKNKEDYKEMLEALNEDNFKLKAEYIKAREYYNSLKERLKPRGDSLFDMF